MRTRERFSRDAAKGPAVISSHRILRSSRRSTTPNQNGTRPILSGCSAVYLVLLNLPPNCSMFIPLLHVGEPNRTPFPLHGGPHNHVLSVCKLVSGVRQMFHQWRLLLPGPVPIHLTLTPTNSSMNSTYSLAFLGRS